MVSAPTAVFIFNIKYSVTQLLASLWADKPSGCGLLQDHQLEYENCSHERTIDPAQATAAVATDLLVETPQLQPALPQFYL